jgi:acryloyl-coenzyme A reductase
MPTRARLTATGFDTPLHLETFSEEPLGADEVRVEVEACGVCHRDLIDRGGRFPWLQLPITPGHEACGRVVEVGCEVTLWSVGDRVGTLHRDHCGECAACSTGHTSLCPHAVWVYGLVVDGGYATELRARENSLYPLPDNTPARDVCALHCTAGTAYRGMVVQGRLTAGQRLLVVGANGGVGAAAIQVATRLGAEVVAQVRREDQIEFVTSQGASEVIVDPGDSFHRKMRAPADVVLDCVGSPTFNASLRSAKMGGHIVIVGNVSRERASLNLGRAIIYGLHLHGSSGATAEDMRALLALHARTPLDLPKLRDRVLPLSEAEQAQQLLREGGLSGRIVLDCA